MLKYPNKEDHSLMIVARNIFSLAMITLQKAINSTKPRSGKMIVNQDVEFNEEAIWDWDAQ